LVSEAAAATSIIAEHSYTTIRLSLGSR
jgi:hypothetical protein